MNSVLGSAFLPDSGIHALSYVFCSLLTVTFHSFFLFFFFNDPAPTEIYTLSLHDALPISPSCSLKVVATETLSNTASTATPASTSRSRSGIPSFSYMLRSSGSTSSRDFGTACRSEEHTSELQSRSDLVCRLLLEKKNTRESARAEPQRPRPRLARYPPRHRCDRRSPRRLQADRRSHRLRKPHQSRHRRTCSERRV